jgi:hypothetical protein
MSPDVLLDLISFPALIFLKGRVNELLIHTKHLLLHVMSSLRRVQRSENGSCKMKNSSFGSNAQKNPFPVREQIQIHSDVESASQRTTLGSFVAFSFCFLAEHTNNNTIN